MTSTLNIAFSSAQAVQGVLERFATDEAFAWAVYDPQYNRPDGKRGFDGVEILDSGDLLRVFTDTSQTKILWEGKVDLDFDAGKKPLPLAPDLEFQRIDGMSVRGLQKNFDPAAWRRMFEEGKPCLLIKKADLSL